ncbi:hypothetical protein M0802_010065 [Mischocyttarus mexicanus]|nr:hypothetical protein M0802_010065 [Mischocyttarus mexicanus]
MSDPQKSDTSLEASSSSSIVSISDDLSFVFDSPSEKDSASDDDKQYYPWTPHESTLENDEYCKLGVVLHTFMKLFKTDLNSIKERQKAIKKLKKLRTRKIVGKKKRFPDKDVYVNLSRSTYASLINRIIAALDCKNNCTVEGRQLFSCSCRYIFISRLRCARSLYFTLPIHEVSIHGIFKRQFFEEWHGLRWE